VKIKWGTPPAPRPGGGGRPPQYAEFFEALRRRPGKWAVFRTDASVSTCTQVKAGKYATTVPGEFDAQFRSDGNSRRGTIYARYIGGTR